MSTLKNLDENVEAVEDEEKEHSRLMKEQERFENESIHDMPNIDDDEYARMIGISESLGRGDEKMTDQDIEDEEEKSHWNIESIAGESMSKLIMKMKRMMRFIIMNLQLR